MLKKRRQNTAGNVRVTFELPAEAGGEVVHLVGDFTDWQGVPMKRRDDGTWTATVDLEPDREYEFRYLIDGERWENDWQADRYVPGPFGNDNSVVETPPLKPATSGASKAKPKAAAKPRARANKASAGPRGPDKKAGSPRGGSRKKAESSPQADAAPETGEK